MDYFLGFFKRLIRTFVSISSSWREKKILYVHRDLVTGLLFVLTILEFLFDWPSKLLVSCIIFLYSPLYIKYAEDNKLKHRCIDRLK